MDLSQLVLFRGESDMFTDLHRDGRTLFFTDNDKEALNYGPVLLEVSLNVEKMFEPGRLAYRKNGDWDFSAKADCDPVESEAFLFALYDRFPRNKVEAIYYHVEGGSWSEVERPEIQSWLRENGYDGFVCWEGDGTTYAVYDPNKVEIIERTRVQAPGMI